MAQQPEAIPCIIFYSWQSDLPHTTNRTFIQNALEKAAKAVRSDESIRIDPVIDRDTQGVPGSPEITRTILNKIDQAQVVVGDVSIINSRCLKHRQPLRPRPTPNPNVLFELGYAQKVLGEGRVLLVMNDVYGKPELLPFDLHKRRAIPYHLPENASEDERADQRRKLEGVLKAHIESISREMENQVREGSGTPSPAPLIDQALTAIEHDRPGQARLVKQYMKQFAAGIAALMPDFRDMQKSKDDDLLIEAMEATRMQVLEFSRLAEAVAINNADEAARALYDGFTHVLDLYWTPREYTSGPFHEAAFDLAKFVGHETFVTLFALLIREGSWDSIGNLLDNDLYVNTKHGGRPGSVRFGYVSQHLLLLEQRKQRLRLTYLTVHGHLLNERHTHGELAQLVPMDQFVDADYFLYVRDQIHRDEEPEQNLWRWHPWSTIYMNNVPRYLEAANRVQGAQRLVRALGERDSPTLRKHFAEQVQSLSEVFGVTLWDDPMNRFDPQSIGKWS